MTHSTKFNTIIHALPTVGVTATSATTIVPIPTYGTPATFKDAIKAVPWLGWVALGGSFF
jgi:hypothetical protein